MEIAKIISDLAFVLVAIAIAVCPRENKKRTNNI
jgi:hypothetical protein